MTKAAPAVLEGVSEAAIRWNDQELWRLAVQQCAPTCGLGRLTADDIQRAFIAFGFPAIRSSVENIVQKDENNTRVFCFLQDLREWLQDPRWDLEQVITSSQAEMSTWVERQIQLFKQSLRTPTREDFEAFKKLAQDSPSAADYWMDSILPQIIPKAGHEVLKSFAEDIYEDELSQLDEDSKHYIAEQLLQASVAFIGEGQDHKDEDALGPSLSLDPKHLEILKDVMRTCLKLQCLEAAARMLAKVGDVDGLAPFERDDRRTQLTLPLLALVDDDLHETNRKPSTAFISSLRALQEASIAAYFDRYRASKSRLRQQDLSNIFHTALLPGETDCVVKSIVSQLESFQLDLTETTTLIEALHPFLPRFLPHASPALITFFDSTVRKHAKLAAISFLEDAAESLELYLRLDVPAAFRDLLYRILDPADLTARFALDPTSDVADPPNALYRRERQVAADSEVVTLVSKLRQMLAQHAHTPPVGGSSASTSTSDADALSESSVCSAVLRAWTHYALGPAPPNNASAKLAAIDRWKDSCTCDPCTALQAFFRAPLDFTTTLSGLTFTVKQHVERCLSAHVTDAYATWKWTYAQSSKHVLTVRKAHAVKVHAVWQARKAVAAQMLRDVGADVEEQAHILGDEYMDFLEWMGGLSEDEPGRRRSENGLAAGTESVAENGPAVENESSGSTNGKTHNGPTQAQRAQGTTSSGNPSAIRESPRDSGSGAEEDPRPSKKRKVA
ncbi:hypothetical protein EIP86_000352 [Pleurotus ostreatoroseus]|nr:hypothetical protein EIP86_000352 [Pleurotus ostreatoroseus]